MAENSEDVRDPADGPGTGVEGETEDGGGCVFASTTARRDAAVRIVAVVGLLLGVTVAIKLVAPGVTNPIWIRTRIERIGALAPLAFVALQTVQVILAPVPGQTLAGVGGYLFGTLWGTGYSMIGVVLGSTAVFLMTQRFGRPYVERVVDPAALTRWDDFVNRAGVPGLFVLFLLPTFPDDVLCFIAGFTEIRLGAFLALIAVGRTPTFVAAAYAGTRLADGTLVGFAFVLTAMAVTSVAVYVTRHRIVARLDRSG